ncbi:hypothetical protein [Paraburkholderia nemoris]|uniref:Uncharacterized protein n=1 Tax=Paraburkholderia nemoris TaxID=2793076 RepID=A0ABM8QYG3_9BURK|nr:MULTISPECIES: hypothetical protein [Paraburkholderia]MBK3810050.1 hypothetical protein [Paraburkholderia aspalathi]CAE6722543.1 hypothetical protein R69776_01598 [Paraburkholderia nemoris]CAE6750573.1 hypothetical protein R75777_02971 [Paraburkholderia nemoris]
MEPSSSRSWSLKCVLEGPLAPYISSFAKSLDDQGFAPESSHVQTRLVADFSRWLKQTHAVLPAITGKHIPRYLRQQGAIEELPTVAVEVTPDRRLLDEYTVYLQQERVKPGIYRPDDQLLALLNGL